MRRNMKHILKISEWKNGILKTYEIFSSSLEEAMSFLKTIGNKSAYIKIYNESGKLVHDGSQNMGEYEESERARYERERKKKEEEDREFHEHQEHDDDDDDDDLYS